MLTQYVPKDFQRATLALIESCNAIIADYKADGYTLTLRQLYYRLVAAALIPNTQKSYDRVGSIINDARLAGVIDWDAIEDRTRDLKSLTHWDNPAEIIAGAARSYRLDKWEGQTYRPEIWIEKEALAGIAQRTAQRNDVGLLACRGYMSQSEMHAAALRFIDYLKSGQAPIVIHLGDHDPSGIDMTRDNAERLEMFISHHLGRTIEVRRIALNMNQIEEYSPPPNAAKVTDSRAAAYIKRFGGQSWELDALEPNVLDSLIENTILEYRDETLWREAETREAQEKSTLAKASNRWESLTQTLAAL
jgi:uncharacterized protein (DUF2249 family)